MTDRELLEMAAKASGIELCWAPNADGIEQSAFDGVFPWIWWNPLEDDADALRLAVKLDIDFYTGADEKGPEAWAGYYLPGRENKKHACVSMVDDPYAATRRAIVCAAAEVGKGLK